MKTIKSFFSTDQQSWSLLIARVALGVTILPHGAQKALGIWGGYGVEGTLGYFESLGIPIVIGFMGILAEFVGSIGLIIGLGTRFMAFSLLLNLTGAMIFGGHIANGFFMNWMGNQSGEGIEFFILAIGLSIALLIGGSGKMSADNLIYNKLD
jgi:putative oxidoreductase